MEITKYQKFEPKTILRSEIKNAPYNPRTITDDNRKKLKKNIQRIGLIETLIVNKNTMNLVSGHQRIAIIDSLERKKDYLITVALVDLTEQEEKEQNIFLNNERAMGEYDLDILTDLLAEINIENIGFTDEDLGILGVELDIETANKILSETESELMQFSELIQDNNKTLKEEKREADNSITARHDTLEDKHENNRAKRVDLINQSQNSNKDSMDVFVTLTFSNHDNKKEFMEMFGYEADDKYIKGEIFQKSLTQETE